MASISKKQAENVDPTTNSQYIAEAKKRWPDMVGDKLKQYSFLLASIDSISTIKLENGEDLSLNAKLIADTKRRWPNMTVDELYQYSAMLYQLTYGVKKLNPDDNYSNPNFTTGEDSSSKLKDLTAELEEMIATRIPENESIKARIKREERLMSRAVKKAEKEEEIRSAKQIAVSTKAMTKIDVQQPVAEDKILNFLDNHETIYPEEVVFESPLMLGSKVREDIKIYMSEYEAVVEEGNVECGKCKQRRLEARPVQTTGADEATTIMYTCVNCGHSFTRR